MGPLRCSRCNSKNSPRPDGIFSRRRGPVVEMWWPGDCRWCGDPPTLRVNEARKRLAEARREPAQATSKLLEFVRRRLAVLHHDASTKLLQEDVDAAMSAGASERAAAWNLGFRLTEKFGRGDGPRVGERIRTRIRRHRQRQRSKHGPAKGSGKLLN
jgi:hypothetical protein